MATGVVEQKDEAVVARPRHRRPVRAPLFAGLVCPGVAKRVARTRRLAPQVGPTTRRPPIRHRRPVAMARDAGPLPSVGGGREVVAVGAEGPRVAQVVAAAREARPVGAYAGRRLFEAPRRLRAAGVAVALLVAVARWATRPKAGGWVLAAFGGNARAIVGRCLEE